MLPYKPHVLWVWAALSCAGVEGELSYCRRAFQVCRADVAQGGMPPQWIVKAFDVVEQVGAGRNPGGVVLRLVRSVLSVEKKLSITELSQTLPLRLMLQVTLSS